MRDPLTCKIAQHTSSEEYILTAGANQGVSRGMRFMCTQDLPVKDPDDPEKIRETLIIITQRLRVTWVGDDTCLTESMDRLWLAENTPDLTTIKRQPPAVGDVVTEIIRTRGQAFKDNVLYMQPPFNLNNYLLGFLSGIGTYSLIFILLNAYQRFFG